MGEFHLAELPYVAVDWRDDGNIRKTVEAQHLPGQRIKPGVIGNWRGRRLGTGALGSTAHRTDKGAEVGGHAEKGAENVAPLEDLYSFQGNNSLYMI